MMHSSSSESGVTVERGLEPVEESEGAGACVHSESDWSSPGRFVIPKAQPAVHTRDQHVPEYWDQTVPVWPSRKPADLGAPCKRKSARASSSGSSYGEGYHTAYYRSSGPRNRGNEKAEKRKRGNATEMLPSKVSFDDIMSMHQSSILSIQKLQSQRSQNLLHF